MLVCECEMDWRRDRLLHTALRFWQLDLMATAVGDYDRTRRYDHDAVNSDVIREREKWAG